MREGVGGHTMRKPGNPDVLFPYDEFIEGHGETRCIVPRELFGDDVGNLLGIHKRFPCRRKREDIARLTGPLP